MKHLLHKGKYKDRIKQMLVIDGNESNGITRGGVGSKRYRVTFKGPGGHSYGAFGIANPIHALGRDALEAIHAGLQTRRLIDAGDQIGDVLTALAERRAPVR